MRCFVDCVVFSQFYTYEFPITMDEVQPGPSSVDSECVYTDMSEEEIRENVVSQNSFESPISMILSGKPVKRHIVDPGSDERVQEDNEGYTLVQRRHKYRRFANSVDTGMQNNNLHNINNRTINNQFEVSLTSYEMLPKQIGLAKLFKSEGINNASSIKYKNAYKVFICFDKREEALSLINNQTFMEKGYRCHFTNEVDLTYGVVKFLEVDISEEEIMKSFTADCKILSVKRLKRLTEEGEWVDSETVRFDFKCAVLPSYVYGYECRFKVEPYTFPVSQCSSCWKYGHLVRSCPSKKTVCPKCGGSHSNCDTTKFRCVNCRGKHIAYDKTCPIFLKEKEIRWSMSQNTLTYKMALIKHSENKSNDMLQAVTSNIVRREFEENNIVIPVRNERIQSMTYSKAVQGGKKGESSTDSEEGSEKSVIKRQNPVMRKEIKKKKKKDKSLQLRAVHNSNVSLAAAEDENSKKEKNSEREKENKDKFNFSRILRKLQEELLTSNNFSEKVQNILKLVFEELLAFCVRSLSHGEVYSKIFGLFNDG